MKLNTPIVTLLAGLVLGVGVLVTSSVWTSGASSATSASGYGVTSPTPAGPTSAPAAASSSPASSSSGTSPAPATSPATSQAPTTAAATSPPPATAPATSPAYVPPKANYVGTVNGGGAAVAISVHGNKAVAYICNGHAIAAWLRGTAANGKLTLTGKNGSHLNLSYRQASAVGSITADGSQYTFSAPMVHRVSSLPRQPGLYEATAMVDGVMVKAGWIVLQNGSQIGSVEYDPGSAIPPTAQAPVLDLATGTAQYDGVTLVASLISGTTGSGF